MTKALDCALRLLARREHGQSELLTKLVQKGHNLEDSEQAVLKCQQLGLQSDTRFVEIICHTRIQQGYGPLKITQELQAKRVDQSLIADMLASYKDEWENYGMVVWRKKFKGKGGCDFNELQKQQRFLVYRGFPRDIIAKIFTHIAAEDTGF